MADLTDRERELLHMVETLNKDLNEARKMIQTLVTLRWATFIIVFLSGAFFGVILYMGSR